MSSSPKGYPNKDKEDRLSAQYATVEPVREKQHGLSVLAHAYVFAAATDLVEANSTTSVINATAHVALVGDVIRFTSGTFNNRQFKVYSVATNTITLAETLSVAPILGDSFEILRHSYARVASDGGISTTPGALQYKRDGADTFVSEDTVTPANNRPLPVKLTDFAGDVTITAANLNVQLSHTGASPDSTQIGDGTDLLLITAAGEANVRTAQLPAALGQLASAASTSVVIASDQSAVPVTAVISGAASSIKIDDGTDTLLITAAGEANVRTAQLPAALGQLASAASTSIVIASDQSSVPVNLSASLPAGTNNIGDVDVLSQPARSHTTDSIRVGDGTDLLLITAAGEALVSVTQPLPAGTNNIGDVDVLSQPVRSHTTDSIRIGDGTDLVNVTAANQLEVNLSTALPAGTNNIGDVDVLTQPARSHTTDSIRLGDGTDLVNVTAANQLEVNLATALPAGTNNIGSVNVAAQTGRSVVTTVRNDYSSVNVTTGAWVQLVASTGAQINEFEIFDSSGQTLELGTGAAAAEVRLIIINPGGNGRVPVAIPSSTRVSIRAVSANATVGEIDINFYS